MTDELKQLAEQAAKDAGLDPALVKAVCHHESCNWESYAMRYEPAFYSRYIEKMVGLSDTEKQLRAYSFGLMQIMGQVAREFGFDGKYLTELLDPAENLKWGCKKLARCMKNAGGDVRKALLAYNGGGNPEYPDLVLRHMEKYSNV